MQDAVAKIGKQMGSNAVKTERTKKIRIGGKPKSGTQGTFASKEIGVTIVENPILEKVQSGASRQTFALPAKEKVSKQMEVASAPTYASILKKGLKWAPVTVHSF